MEEERRGEERKGKKENRKEKEENKKGKEKTFQPLTLDHIPYIRHALLQLIYNLT